MQSASAIQSPFCPFCTPMLPQITYSMPRPMNCCATQIHGPRNPQVWTLIPGPPQRCHPTLWQPQKDPSSRVGEFWPASVSPGQDGRKPGDRPLVACPLFYALSSGSRVFDRATLTPAACFSAVVIFGSPLQPIFSLLCGLRYVSWPRAIHGGVYIRTCDIRQNALAFLRCHFGRFFSRRPSPMATQVPLVTTASSQRENGRVYHGPSSWYRWTAVQGYR